MAVLRPVVGVTPDLPFVSVAQLAHCRAVERRPSVTKVDAALEQQIFDTLQGQVGAAYKSSPASRSHWAKN